MPSKGQSVLGTSGLGSQGCQQVGEDIEQAGETNQWVGLRLYTAHGARNTALYVAWSSMEFIQGNKRLQWPPYKRHTRCHTWPAAFGAHQKDKVFHVRQTLKTC